MAEADQPTLTIGEFSHLTRLTPKALRIYERQGLLAPALVDDATGYRRYRPGQVRGGQLISLLREADLSLADIGEVLREVETRPEGAVLRLERHLADLSRHHADRKVLIRHVQSTLRQGDDPMFPIQTRHVASARVMTMQRRLHAHETNAFAQEAKAAFAARLEGREPTGPFTMIFHGVVDADSDGPLEIIQGCPDDVQPDEKVGVRTEPAHDEAYTVITKAQWDFPAILAAYDAVACCPEVLARPGSRLSCREVYWTDPDTVARDEPVCDVAFPMAAASA